MATSQALLTLIAIRLAGLVVAGCIATAAPDIPRQEIGYIHGCNNVAMQIATTVKPIANDIMSEMRLYD